MSKVDQTTLKMLSDVVATMAQMVEAMANSQEESKAESPLLTKKELAAYIKKSESWINKHREELPQAVSDRPVTWLRKDIDEWLEARRIEKEKKSVLEVSFEDKTFSVVRAKGVGA